VRILFCLVALACVETTQARYVCRLPDQQLIDIARRDRAEECKSPRNCEFHVMEEERDYWCAVQVWFSPELVGDFVTLVISNKGKVTKRTPGV
jgi:hypothetical protein